MKLRFIANFRVLEILDATQTELDQLEKLSTAHGYNWRTKEKWSKCFMQNYKYIPAGFWLDIMELTKAKRPWNVNIINMKDLFYNITHDEFNEWLDEQPLKFPPRWYQAKGAYLALKYRISKGQFATSAGKSFIQFIVCRYGLQKMVSPDKKILVIVPSIMLVNQLAEDFDDYATDDLVVCDRIFGGSKRNKDGNVVISTIDSLANREKDFFTQFEMILVDEAHKLTTKTYQEVISWIPYQQIKLIYAVSGTFHDKGTYEAMIQQQYGGPTLIDITASQLMEEGSVTPLKIKVLNLRYGYDISEGYYNFDGISTTDGRNLAELKYIQSLSKRFKMISNTVAKIDGNQLLLFKSVEYAEMMAEYLKRHNPNKEVFVIHGGIKSKTRDYIRKRSEEIDNGIICATYATMSTGVSIKRLTYLHLMESAKSFIMLRQSIGRTLRLHPSKDYAIVVDYVDIFKRYEKHWSPPMHGNISARQAKSRQKIYKEQNFEFTVHDVNIN
ncbi:DNA helicase [Tenacibaculum phage PTm1]|uniref:DNA helicase n=2 Tax=Shirahamavirus PTm1 TaxID=2846435 RepID=A0A5S9EQH9_9CAUD|nr:DNA helicase [Tenacibaculum phage PTm1]BBI90432.1 DNA helicase [Tenacibaculum phage PTm1]BBI90739.1 DNA helicase [Tenacibaculum phage PTm5]